MILDEKYTVSGMSCAACANRIENAVKKLKGIKEVNVNLLTNTMIVSYDERLLNEQKIIKAVIDAGYNGEKAKSEVEETSEDILEELEDKSTPIYLRRLIISLILLVPLFYLAMGFMMSWPLGALGDNLYILGTIELILASAIMVINRHFFISGFKSIIHFSLNMDTLVTLASLTAYIYSFILLILIYIATFTHNDLAMAHHYMMNISFETAGMVPALITIGKTLESFSKGKTTDAIKNLVQLSPKTVTLYNDEKEEIIPIDDIKVDDIFIVKPGESIAVDALITKGNSYIDESLLSGESFARHKKEGDIVKSATINKDGTIICKALRVGKDTTINQIIKNVKKVNSTKPKIAKLADKVSAIFVPTVIIIALLVFAGYMIFGGDFIANHPDIHEDKLSYALLKAISVLVISCPCALGLATPTAIMVSSGVAAKNGILYKNATSIEETGKIDFIALDKTGTITEGKPSVEHIVVEGNVNKHLSYVAYSLEKGSSHPLGKAILDFENKHDHISIETENVVNVPGKGVKGIRQGSEVLGGSLAFLKENGVSFRDGLEEEVNEKTKDGKSIVAFAEDKKLLGYYIISDKIKENSYGINLIQELGITPVMVTGDNYNAANYIASLVNIPYVVSNTLPEGKLDVVNELKKYGKVMMVGDGINDAIALSASDVSLVMASGSDVAISSGDVVLVNSSLYDAYLAINLSRYTYLNIIENLVWAFLYNIIMIPFAAGAFSLLGIYKLYPWMASAAMALSSSFVVLNALRINLFDVKHSHKYLARKPKEVPEILKKINQCEINKGKENMFTTTLKIEGMMCMHCVKHVKEALEGIKNVTNVEVSLEKNEAVVTSKKEIKMSEFKKVIDKAGYKVIK